MNALAQVPATLLEVIRYFDDPNVCLECMVELRWPSGIACPVCGCMEPSFLSTRRIWKCKGCKKQFSVKLGTIFEDSPIGLDKWLTAIWLIANAKNGISSYELHRSIGVTQKTAWFMLHRIRYAMQTGSFEKMSGVIEADETFVGGLEKNKHESKKLHAGRGGTSKAIVTGLLERVGENGHSVVRAGVVSDRSRETLHAAIQANVEQGSLICTDAHEGYKGLEDYMHEWVNHLEEYAREAVHTNGMENFWSLLKRGLKGTYVNCDAHHLQAYVDEQAFRFNERKGKDADRFKKAARGVTGKRLTYAELTER